MEDKAMLPRISGTVRLPNIINRFFDDDVVKGFFDENNTVNAPAVNITEDNEGYDIELAAPGLKKKDVEINVEDNVLTISSEKKEDKKDDEQHYVRREFHYGSFKRAFELPEDVDVDKIEAKHEDGVLHISMPKKEEAKVKPARKIEIA
jgi:HSP20 family protein